MQYPYTVVKSGPVFSTVVISCPFCGTDKEIKAPNTGLLLLAQGKHVQNAFPKMPAHEREMFISGICGACFDRICGDDRDADEGLADKETTPCPRVEHEGSDSGVRSASRKRSRREVCREN